MTDIDVYDFSGNYLKSMTGQLALQYAYNIGGQSSCWATKKTVSELLYGLEIDAYFSMNMGSIAEINDALGGVDVTIPILILPLKKVRQYIWKVKRQKVLSGTEIWIRLTAYQTVWNVRPIM